MSGEVADAVAQLIARGVPPVAAVEAAKAMASGGIGGGPTVRELFAKYEPFGKGRFRSWPRTHRGTFENHLLPHFGDMLCRDLSHDLVDAYTQKRQGEESLTNPGEPPSNRTINHEVSTLRAMLSWGLKRKHVLANPLLGWEKLPEDDNHHAPVFEEELAEIVRLEPDETMRLMWVLAFETGMRLREWSELRWAEVHLDRTIIHLPAERTKANRERSVVLSDTAMEVLRRARVLQAADPSPWVFPNRHPLARTPGTIPVGTIQFRFAKAKARAGIETGPIHGLRHGFGREGALKKGVPIRAMMEQLGHRSIDVHMGYTGLTPEHVDNVRGYLNGDRLGPQSARPPLIAVLDGMPRARRLVAK